jgi:hypothetical protein
MKQIDKLKIIDITPLEEKINRLKLLRTKAIEEESYETAQWIEGKIDAIKLILSESEPLSTTVKESFEKGWELCGKINLTYNESLNDYLTDFKLTQTK